MSGRALLRLLGLYAALVVACAGAVFACVRVDAARRPRAIVATVWKDGQAAAREELPPGGDHEALRAAALSAGSTLVHEAVIDAAPVATRPEALFAVSFVAGLDGASATLGPRTVYVTPDDLLSRQAYERGVQLPGLGLSVGVDVFVLHALLAERLGITVPELRARASIRRVRFARTIVAPPEPPASAGPLDRAALEAAAFEAAGYLSRGLEGGRFRFLVDATRDRALPGYDWPRHAGATFFLAQAAGRSKRSDLRAAALAAAGHLATAATQRCGDDACVGDGALVDVGASALALLAFAEIAGQGLDVSGTGWARGRAAALARFLRSMQREDGDLRHLYDPAARRAIDVQLPYYTGEAALALSRASRVTGDVADLDAASRALARLVRVWRFFGDRYYFGEEHWTCQAMQDLWDRRPDRGALALCLRWQAYNRRLQIGPAELPYDADGAYGVAPFVVPRLTAASSRGEAALATLAVAREASAGVSAEEIGALERQVSRSMALLARHQLGAAGGRVPSYLLARPDAVKGAVPGSAVDWQVRVDFPQHAGSAFLRAAAATVQK